MGLALMLFKASSLETVQRLAVHLPHLFELVTQFQAGAQMMVGLKHMILVLHTQALLT